MTTRAIVCGMRPVAPGRGDGASSRAARAIAVVGAPALGVVGTRLITPIIDAVFGDPRGWPGRRLAAGLTGRRDP
jgi:HAE1 family hydrophobic/amphiphilic exporter-1